MSVDDAIGVAVDFFEFESSRREARQEKAEANQQAVAEIELGNQERQLVREQATQLQAQQIAAGGASGAEGGSFNAAQFLSLQRAIQEEERILKGRLDVAQAILRRGRRVQKARKREGITSLALGISTLVRGGLQAGSAIGKTVSTFGLETEEQKKRRPFAARDPERPGLLS